MGPAPERRLLWLAGAGRRGLDADPYETADPYTGAPLVLTGKDGHQVQDYGSCSTQMLVQFVNNPDGPVEASCITP